MQGECVNDVCLDGLEVENNTSANQSDALQKPRHYQFTIPYGRDEKRTMSGAIQWTLERAVQPVMNNPIGKAMTPGNMEAIFDGTR